MHATLARTLAYCLFWSQHAQHFEDDAPVIWKTGPELESDLMVAARTGNRHLKELAALGYWDLTYRPRPGTIGPVTWLRFSPKSLALLGLAREQTVFRTSKKKAKSDTSGNEPMGHAEAVQHTCLGSQDVTSKQKDHSEKTTKNEQSFFLLGNAGKLGKNEASSSHSSGEVDPVAPKPPSYVKASLADREFASTVREVWLANGLQEWDWSSAYTWSHIAEIVKKRAKQGALSPDGATFLAKLIENWSWMRSCLTPRYAHHHSNTHAPSPMAFAHQFDLISKMVSDKMQKPKLTTAFLDLDDGF